MPRRRKEDLSSAEHSPDLGTRIVNLLTTAEKPMSKTQIAKALGIELLTPEGTMTLAHIDLVSHLNTLTKHSFYGTRVKTAAYLGQPKDTRNIIGQGTYGYYLASREQEMIAGGYLEAEERSFSLMSELDPDDQRRYDQTRGVKGVDPLAEEEYQPDTDEELDGLLAQQLREIFSHFRPEYE